MLPPVGIACILIVANLMALHDRRREEEEVKEHFEDQGGHVKLPLL